jgi:hypothetical protein
MLVDQLTTSLVRIGLGKPLPLATPRRTTPGDGSGRRLARTSRQVERASGDGFEEGDHSTAGRETVVVFEKPELSTLPDCNKEFELGEYMSAGNDMASPADSAAAAATRPPAATQRIPSGTAVGVGVGERPLVPQPSPALRRAASPHCRRLLSPRITRPRISAGAADRLRTAYCRDDPDD